jgi:ATP-binding cassette subfamily F protein 3
VLWLVHDGRVASFDGDLDDYAAIVLASRREKTEAADEDNGVSRKQARKQEAAERQRLANARKPLTNKLQKIEAAMNAASHELRELDAKLADANFYHDGDPTEVATTMKRRGELALQVETLEAQWLEVTEQIEAVT